MLLVRAHRNEDLESIDAVHRAAFATPAEAALVRALIQDGQARISLVAELEGQVAGHVLFSPVKLAEHPEITGGLGLAPLAVLPHLQRRGIGSALAREGLSAAAAAGAGFAVVLGSPLYYPRFGFSPAAALGLRSVYTDGDEFMVIELRRGCLGGATGLVQYAAQFDAFE